MSCPDLKQKIYLYLSGELTSTEKSVFEKHLDQCSACKNTLEEIKQIWDWVEHLSYEKPSLKVKQEILKQARKKKNRFSFPNRLVDWLSHWLLPHPRLSWGVTVSAVTLILVILLLSPFKLGEKEKTIPTELLEWQDDFFAQVDCIDREIDRVGSGELLVSYFSQEYSRSESEDRLSSMSQDLNWIRGEIENLTKTIFGL